MKLGCSSPSAARSGCSFGPEVGAGKRGGESGLPATLIKATAKKVFMQTRPDGKSRKVTYTGHVVEELRQLVNAARVGRFPTVIGHRSCCTPSKVPGATGLENSRPVDHPEALQKKSYAFDYAAIAEVWKEKGLLHNWQYAFRAKKGHRYYGA